MDVLKHILVATDFSKKADNALVRAIDIAKQHKAKITLIYVTERNHPHPWINKLIPALKKIMISPKVYAQQEMSDVIRSYAHKIKMKGEVITGQPAAEQLLRYVKKHKIDLIVMGARGEYSVRDWFIGATTESVVKKTKIPVLVVKNIPRKTYDNILIPIDFSLPSQRALKLANQLMARAKLKILHVMDHEYDALLQSDNIDGIKVKSMRKTITQALKDKMAKFITNSGIDKFSYEVKAGYPSLVITKQAKKQSADLIVMGTSGHNKNYHVLLGRVERWCFIKRMLMFY